MKILTGLNQDTILENAFLTIGVYDGVHIGHRKILETLVNDARKNNGNSAVITFHPHPLRLLLPQYCPPLITSTGHKMSLIEQIGIDYCFVIPFTKEFAQTPAETFFNNDIFKHFQVSEICVGYDFTFGKDKKGNMQLLSELSEKNNFTLKKIDPVKLDDLIVSSSQIRKLIIAGEFELAELMLGRKYSLWGTVVEGYTIGRKIGYPTANLDPHHEAIPPSGVYIVKLILDGKIYKGILNIGYRPTFQEKKDLKETIEVHIFDFNENIYAKNVEVIFLKKLRDEKRYPDTQSLVTRINMDVQQAKKYFENNNIY